MFSSAAKRWGDGLDRSSSASFHHRYHSTTSITRPRLRSRNSGFAVGVVAFGRLTHRCYSSPTCGSRKILRGHFLPRPTASRSSLPEPSNSNARQRSASVQTDTPSQRHGQCPFKPPGALILPTIRPYRYRLSSGVSNADHDRVDFIEEVPAGTSIPPDDCSEITRAPVIVLASADRCNTTLLRRRCAIFSMFAGLGVTLMCRFGT